EFILTWHASPELMRRQFDSLAMAAGLEGTIKKLRKSAATDVELRFPGCGAAFLGHAHEMGIAGRHYLDPRLLIQTRPMPRPLRTLDQQVASNRDMAIVRYLADFFESEKFCTEPWRFATPVQRFSERLGREALLSDLTMQNLHAFETWLVSSHYRNIAETLEGIRSVWRHAFASGLCEQVPPPLRPARKGGAP
ncbi:MAG TPA: hypothetical protein VG713_02055, partial [Pirellulales bacterium]|nr:hypothetical protein [Pirellulales bacterium]